MNGVDELEAEIAELAAHLDSATQRLLACVRAFDEAGGWERQGAISCAHWLAWRLGLDTATAREKVRVARALGQLRRIDEAFGQGRLSYAKVRAITRVATPENEPRLLEMALHATGAQLERICRGYRQAMGTLGDDGPIPEERTVRERLLPGGMVKVEMVLHPDEAALVMSAIDRAREELRQTARGAADVSAEASPAKDHGQDPTPSAADGAVLLAETALCACASTATSAPLHQIFIHLDQEALGPDGQWTATLDDGTRLPAETLRRVACDAALVPAASDPSGTVLDVGRRTRAIPPALRRALWLRDRGCRFPGCPHTRFLHGHHVRHWLHGGRTSLDNLILLCSRHHRLVHEGGFSLELHPVTGVPTFRAPAGAFLLPNPPRDVVGNAVERLQIWAAEHERELGPDTNLPIWDGAIPDYDWAVSSLLAEA